MFHISVRLRQPKKRHQFFGDESQSAKPKNSSLVSAKKVVCTFFLLGKATGKHSIGRYGTLLLRQGDFAGFGEGVKVDGNEVCNGCFPRPQGRTIPKGRLPKFN